MTINIQQLPLREQRGERDGRGRETGVGVGGKGSGREGEWEGRGVGGMGRGVIFYEHNFTDCLQHKNKRYEQH